MNSACLLLKLGGAALNGNMALESVAAAIKDYRAQGFAVVLVHGGGPAINAELTRRGITWTFSKGQRVTSNAMIDIIESTLCGTVNRRVVRQLAAQGLPTIGLSGSDQQLLLCQQASAELGLVGAIQNVNVEWLRSVLALPSQPVPVIAPVGVGINGECYNINADWAASHLAAALGVQELLFFTDQPGVLDEEGQVIQQMSANGMRNMIDCNIVSGGMLAKTQAALYALENGVMNVRILHGQDAFRVCTDPLIGTLCTVAQAADVRHAEDSYAAV